jgi:hypothetical protein
MARNVLNRRRYRRIQAPIHCRRAGGEFFGAHIEPVDISFGGLRVFSDEEHPVGAVVRLDVFFPRAAPVTFDAQVMWINPLAPGARARFDIGLAFVKLTPGVLNALHPFLDPEEDSEAPESGIDLTREPAESAVEIDLEEPASEVRPSTPAPLTVRQGGTRRPKLWEIPVLVAGADHLRAARLDGRAGFVLSLIDGVSTVETLLDVSGMPAHETLGILEDLRQLGIIELRRGTLEL